MPAEESAGLEAVQIGQRGARRVTVSRAPLMLLPVDLPPTPPRPRRQGVGIGPQAMRGDQLDDSLIDDGLSRRANAMVSEFRYPLSAKGKDA